MEGALNQDSKTQLNQFCQKYCKKVISKADVVYETQKFGDTFQSTLTLACLGNAQFAGEPAPNQKQAEQNAAKIALDNYAAEIASLPVSVSKNNNNKKRKAADAGLGGVAPAGVADPSQNSRCLLNTALMKVLKRPVTKEDMTKSSVQTALGFQCTLSIPGLPAEWAGLAWAGEAASNLKDAEESAATYALEALRQDPTFAQIIDSAPAAKKPKTTGGGKGAGPTNQQAMWALTNGELSGATPGGGGGWGKGGWGKDGGWGKGGWGKGGGKGKGKGKAQGPKPREQVSEVPILGKVLEWKGKFGWIQPNDAVDHPSAQKNKGKIFLHCKDWQQGDTQPQAGQDVQFTLYSDPSGLGAENVLGF